MSTGLTYLTVCDTNGTVDPFFTSPIVFSSYEEAYSFADWICRYWVSYYGGSIGMQILIYTTGPNANGVMIGTNPPAFSPFD
jgi:hypothetical protein